MLSVWNDFFIKVQVIPLLPGSDVISSSESTISLTAAQKLFLSYSLMEKNTHCNKTSVPTTKMWLDDLHNTLHLKKIWFALRNKLSI